MRRTAKDNTPASQNWVRRFIISNLGWLVGSLTLAVIVWYAAWTTQDPVLQRHLSGPFKINVKFDPAMMVIAQSQDTAQVTVRALQGTLNELSDQDINVTADMTGRGPGGYDVDLTSTLNSARHGQVIDILPRRIHVELAKRAEKLVTISAQYTAQPPVGFFIFPPTLSDTQAKVSGPEDKVKQVVSVEARINPQDRQAQFSTTVSLLAIDADSKVVSGITLTPNQVTADVYIQERVDGTVLQVIPIFSGELPAGYLRSNYRFTPSRVFVRGDRTAIDGMQGSINTEAIDLSGKTASFQQTVKLVLPSGVTLPDPTDVNVTVEVTPELISRTFANIPVQPQGLDPADFLITVTPQQINVTVTGPRPVVDALTANDISVFAPLRGLNAGASHQVTLQGSVTKAGIDSQNIALSETQAEVTITARNPTITPTPNRSATQAATP